MKILDGVEDIAIHAFSDKDGVRHKLVQKIILAYEKHERELAAKAAEKAKPKYRYKRETEEENK